MDDVTTFPGGLRVEHHVSDDSATVTIGGPLDFPDAVAVSGIIKHIIEYQPSQVLLDLTDMEHVDGTGIAVLVGIGGDLKNADIQVSVIAADPRIRHRLPYTLGLRKIFSTVDEARRYRP
jgi:anti-anti-sigma factor